MLKAFSDDVLYCTAAAFGSLAEHTVNTGQQLA